MLACVLGVVLAGPAADAMCRAEVVRPETGERRTAFLVWLKAHAKEVGFDEPRLLEGPDPPLDAFPLFFADVDNDGSDDAVLTDHQGSGHFLVLWIFRRVGGGWVRATFPGGWTEFGHEFVDPASGDEQLLVRFCARTYFTFLGGAGPHYSPDAYVWEKGSLKAVCDDAWLADRRRVFQTLFDRRLFDAAHGYLDGVQAACAAAADPETWLWMQSDLALTAHRMQTDADCLEHVAAARRSTGFGRAGSALRRALEANATLCAQARAKGATAAYDFSWLREYEGDERRQFVLDPRFPGLLSAVVPDVRIDDVALRDTLAMNLYLNDPARIVAKRYVVLSGCRPHDCSNKGLIWIDTTAKRSIVAAGDLLASRTIDSAHVPEEFWEHVRSAWIVPDVLMDYLGPDGKTQIETR